MAKKKRSKISRYKRRRNGGLVSQASDMAVRIGAGFAGYTAGRFVSRAVYQMALQKFPQLAKHGAVVAGLGSAVGAIYAADKWKALDEYKDEIVIGAGIAALQTAAQAYMPSRFAWLASDFFHGPYANAAQSAQKAQDGFAHDSLDGILPPLDGPQASAPAPKPRAALPAPRQAPQAVQPPAAPDFDLDAFMAEHNLEEASLGGDEDPMGSMADMGDDASFGGLLN